jgi:nicotinate-nucleotide pyrophosphorylase (carboxylating)
MNLAAEIVSNVSLALKEDIGSGDLTDQYLQTNQDTESSIISRQPASIAGQPWCNEVIRQVDKKLTITWLVKEGGVVDSNQVIAKVHGPLVSQLKVERTLLNFLQLCSGIATTTSMWLQAIKPYKTKILDTRKTIPSLRQLQKYAVKVAGGHNHRMGLYDAILVKENHIMGHGDFASLVDRVVKLKSHGPVWVEVENMTQYQIVINKAVDGVLLDNWSIDQVKYAVSIKPKGLLLEASGGINLQNVASYAATGVDRISIGALTKDISSIDLTMLFLKPSITAP